jgi:hypothetical protein
MIHSLFLREGFCQLPDYRYEAPGMRRSKAATVTEPILSAFDTFVDTLDTLKVLLVAENESVYIISSL